MTTHTRPTHAHTHTNGPSRSLLRLEPKREFGWGKYKTLIFATMKTSSTCFVITRKLCDHKICLVVTRLQGMSSDHKACLVRLVITTHVTIGCFIFVLSSFHIPIHPIPPSSPTSTRSLARHRSGPSLPERSRSLRISNSPSRRFSTEDHLHLQARGTEGSNPSRQCQKGTESSERR